MKNIHLFPTDKPSRLYLFEERLILGDLVTVVFKNSGAVNQHIYITSDEEIKEGDKGWLLEDSNIKSVCKFNTIYGMIGLQKTDKKIILTTDQELIKHGVQAIDDEFLEWFVKNPSCEYIQTTELSLFNGDTGESGHYKYEVIIPQEEAKQDTVGKEFYEKADEVIVIHRPKQETLEQTAVEWFYDKVIQKQYKDIDDSLEDLFEQAKEMEKKQIIEAWIAEDNPLQRLKAEQYYNETFKTK
jgi:hypothetical protein